MKTSILLLCFITSLAWSHAHIFVDWKVHALADSSGFKGIYVNWTFDQMFASFIKEEFDLDKDNQLSKEEQKKLYISQFSNLYEENYFSVLTVNGKQVKVPNAKNFSARLLSDFNRVTYTFFLPVPIAAGSEKKKVELHFVDPVMYIDFAGDLHDVTFKNKAPESISLEKGFREVKYTKRAQFTIVEESKE